MFLGGWRQIFPAWIERAGQPFLEAPARSGQPGGGVGVHDWAGQLLFERIRQQGGLALKDALLGLIQHHLGGFAFGGELGLMALQIANQGSGIGFGLLGFGQHPPARG